MDFERLKEIRERLESATPGGWSTSEAVDDSEYGSYVAYGIEEVAPIRWYADSDSAHTALDPLEKSDAEFIAHSKSDIEFLLGALVQAYEDGVEHWQAVESWDSDWDDYPEPPYWLQVVQ